MSALAFCAAACGQQQDASAGTDTMPVEQLSPTLPPSNEGSGYFVESDPKASYRLLSWHTLKDGHIEAVTRRDGPSGTSFTRLEIDCTNRLYRVLGEGDDRGSAMHDTANIGEMTDLVAGSIKDVTVSTVCKAK